MKFTLNQISFFSSSLDPTMMTQQEFETASLNFFEEDGAFGFGWHEEETFGTTTAEDDYSNDYEELFGEIVCTPFLELEMSEHSQSIDSEVSQCATNEDDPESTDNFIDDSEQPSLEFPIITANPSVISVDHTPNLSASQLSSEEDSVSSQILQPIASTLSDESSIENCDNCSLSGTPVVTAIADNSQTIDKTMVEEMDKESQLESGSLKRRSARPPQPRRYMDKRIILLQLSGSSPKSQYNKNRHPIDDYCVRTKSGFKRRCVSPDFMLS
jgi:hypothetical protein